MINNDVASIFSVRIANALKASEIYTIADLLSKNEFDLTAIPGIGVGSIKIIKQFLQIKNLFLKEEKEMQEDQNDSNKPTDLDLIQEATDLILKYRHLGSYAILKAIEYANDRASVIINKKQMISQMPIV